MFQHYPEYSGAPYAMMNWLRDQALANEKNYAAPNGRTKIKGGQPEDEKEEVYELEKGGGLSVMETGK